MTQAERLVRREELRNQIAKLEESLAELRAEEERVLEACEHAYADGRHALVGSKIRVCSVCGRVVKGRDEKLWG